MKNLSIKQLALFTAVGLAFTAQSCKHNPVEVERGSAIEVEVSVQGVGQVDKLSKAEASKTAFAANDKFGMWVVPFVKSEAPFIPSELRGIDNYVDNALYTYSGSAWSTTAEVYYPNAITKVDLYAATPYDANMSIQSPGTNSMPDPKAYAFEIKKDQSAVAGADVIASDIMTANAAAAVQGSTPALTFKHRMSKIMVKFNLVKGTYKGQTITSVTSVELRDVQLKSTINITDNSVAPAIVTTNNPKSDVLAYCAKSPVGNVVGDYEYEAIIMPGTSIAVGSDIARITLDVNGTPVAFNCKVSTAAFTYNAAEQTTITVNLDDQTEITLNAANILIGAWGTQTPPASSVAKSYRMNFTAAGASIATVCPTIKYAELTIDGETYRADVTYAANNLQCIYGLAGDKYPYTLTAVKFLKEDGVTQVTPASFAPAVTTLDILGDPTNVNLYTKVISTATFN